MLPRIPVGRVAALLLAAASATAHAAPAMAPLPDTAAGWARGAQLFDGLGNSHRAVSTAVPLAQRYFDQGLRLLWAFNHDEAARSFAQAAQLDPACAACDWGLALALGPNYNRPQMDATRAAVAAQALAQAEAHAVAASAIERALLEALKRRDPTATPLDAENITAALTAYATAMRAVAARFPEDLDVQTLCAEAEMNVHAWQLWGPDGTPAEGTLQLERRLEAVLSREPQHPGANHYYIHVMEESPHPEKALDAAERLAQLMPGAGHLEHMPAHIFVRLGRWEQAAEANRQAIAADQAYLAAATPVGDYRHYLAHNYALLAYAAAMEGRKAETLAAVQGVEQQAPRDMTHMADMGTSDAGWNRTRQYAALVRFGLWDEMLALPPPQGGNGQRAGYLYARGVALAARGRLDEAREALAQLRAVQPHAGPDGEELTRVLRVAVPVVSARIAATEGHDADAVKLLEQAVAAEDQLPYREPPSWFFPGRQLLGAQLLLVRQPRRAEQVYREELRRTPHDGWSLFGLAAALRAQGRRQAAAQAEADFAAAWRYADVRLTASAFWFAGADTTRCECQREGLR